MEQSKQLEDRMIDEIAEEIVAQAWYAVFCPQCRCYWAWNGKPIRHGPHRYTPTVTIRGRATCPDCDIGGGRGATQRHFRDEHAPKNVRQYSPGYSTSLWFCGGAGRWNFSEPDECSSAFLCQHGMYRLHPLRARWHD